ncbi:Transcriptional regulatory protein YpdB [Luteitalea pratensis]|uniref:Transcriptional regulatory protein YpdB n=1 Tax=Luteitalea pratensis TaxID=1855912 RepID=A0A143PH72_LUTPR|nr:LytTR family DNA-binding domain-containing protein [Luteitalea pratensis]AMY07114.1 Transcriptional regulatory protein YpdB [Luteitalea pratensis]
MSRFRALVVDDEPLSRGMVAAILREDGEMDVVLECADAMAAQELIRSTRPDIVFLDIEMPEVTGLDLARELGEDGPVVVFVTAFNRYTPDAFEVSASDYVLKPFSDQRFADALQRPKRRVRERRLGALAQQLATLSSELRLDDETEPVLKARAYVEQLSFKQNDRQIVVPISDVYWIEAEDYYVRIHSQRGRHLVRTPLATLEARLNPRDFLRVHRGAIVNVQKVVAVRDAGGLMLVLADGTEVPVSRSRRAAVESSLLPRANPPRP